MECYVAFLRGINVGGKNRVKMEQLKSLFVSMGFSNVTTYIQSGNIVFATDTNDIVALNNNIEVSLEETFGFKIPCILRTLNELKDIISKNPFQNRDMDHLYVTLLAAKPHEEAAKALDTYKNQTDDFLVLNGEIYLMCHAGYSDTKFTNKFFETKLNNTATTRNWKTLNKMIDLALNNNLN